VGMEPLLDNVVAKEIRERQKAHSLMPDRRRRWRPWPR